jgi:MSHA pilin protein MshD
VAGFTLVEMIIAIVIIGVGVTGVLVAYMASVKGSADALVGKQLVAIAEGMMEEVLLKPYAQGPGTGASSSALGCGNGASRLAFDDVRDYNGYQTTDVCDMNGDAVAGLAGYRVAVTAVVENFSGITADTVHVRVTATRGGQSMVLDGFRTNYGRW